MSLGMGRVGSGGCLRFRLVYDCGVSEWGYGLIKQERNSRFYRG